jgi:hypothetical protein
LTDCLADFIFNFRQTYYTSPCVCLDKTGRAIYNCCTNAASFYLFFFMYMRQLNAIVLGCEAFTSSKRDTAVLRGAFRTFSGFA